MIHNDIQRIKWTKNFSFSGFLFKRKVFFILWGFGVEVISTLNMNKVKKWKQFQNSFSLPSSKETKE